LRIGDALASLTIVDANSARRSGRPRRSCVREGAKTDPARPITMTVGADPFRFNPDRWVRKLAEAGTRCAGMTVDLQDNDEGAVITRRGSRNPPDPGELTVFS
jgi:hypothetical protein